MNAFLALVSIASLSSVICTPTGYRFPLPLPNAAYPIYSTPAPFLYSAPAPLPAAPIPLPAPLPTYKSESYSTSDHSKTEYRDDAGQYSLSYITGNGIRVSERSYLKAYGEGYIPVKEGTYEYTSPDGTPVSYGYKADENGFNLKGYPLPLAPVQTQQ